MLVRELIAAHVGAVGAVHERGIRLSQAQVPPGVRVHHEGEGPDGGAGRASGGGGVGDAAVVQGGDLLVVRAPVGVGLREQIDTDLPLGASVLLLLEVDVAQVPVGRVLAALAVARLQVVEAAVVSATDAKSGHPVPTVAVVATRTDDPIVPTPYLAHDLEPGKHDGPAVLRRVLGEHALEGLVQRARERALAEQVAEIGAQLAAVTAERDKLRAAQLDHESMARDLAASRKEADTERKRMLSLVRDMDGLREKADTARKDAEHQRKLMRDVRASRSFKLASRLARVSGPVRRIVPRS